jgi:hypothetical protein
MATTVSVLAFALLRVPRGAPRPSEEAFREAIARDRAKLRLPALNGHVEYAVAGPYEVVVDGSETDEYAVWEK